MKKLVVCAHLDDEMFGLGGSIIRWRKYNDDVRIIVMCHGRTVDDGAPRKETFKHIMSELSVDYEIYSFDDLTLDSHFSEVVAVIQKEVDTYQPTQVYSTSETDLHRDHQIVGEATKLACRPMSGCSVRELFQFYIPGASDWSFNETLYNVAHDISEEITTKLTFCGMYTTEIKDNDTHPGSIDGIESINKTQGNRFGLKFAELMRLVYKR